MSASLQSNADALKAADRVLMDPRSMSTYYRGLDGLIGLPNVNIDREMEREHCQV